MSDLPRAEELAQYTLDAQHPITRRWADDDTRLRRLTEDHELDVLLATDLDVARRRAERFSPAASSEEFLNRWVPVGGDLHAMLSIRYEGEDAEKPFVDASTISRPLLEADLAELARAACDVFGRLRPRYLRLWSERPPGAFPGTASDKRFLAERIVVLRDIGVATTSSLDLRAASGTDNYEKAVEAYDAVDREHPEHPEQAAVQSREDLQDAASEGLLFDAYVGEDWAGLVATTRHGPTLGLPAHLVLELVLAPRFRGRGLGPRLTTLLARVLPDAREDVLLGTIHAENKGAVRAATAAGRVDVGGWLQVPLS